MARFYLNLSTPDEYFEDDVGYDVNDPVDAHSAAVRLACRLETLLPFSWTVHSIFAAGLWRLPTKSGNELSPRYFPQTREASHEARRIARISRSCRSWCGSRSPINKDSPVDTGGNAAA